MTLRHPVITVEYLRLRVEATRDGDTFDPTNGDVEIAAVAQGTAVAGTDFVTAEWEAGGPPYFARALIGTGTDLELEAGTYDCYVRVTATPEVPVFKAARLQLYGEDTLFATVTELSDHMGVAIDPEDSRSFALLEAATALIRSRTGQYISFVEDDDQELRGNWTDRLWLPQKPVVDVSEVSVRHQGEMAATTLDVSAYTVDRRGLLQRLDGWWWGHDPAGCWGGPAGQVLVTYSHGYTTVPEDIRAATLALASRAMSNPDGAESESIGSYSITYAKAESSIADVGITGMESAVIEKYALAAQENW